MVKKSASTPNKPSAGETKQADMDDARLFQQMMGDVRPLKTEPKVMPAAKPPPARPPAASPASEPLGPYAERDHAPPVEAEEFLQFARSGIQHRVMKQLKRGDIPTEAELDLHGLRITQAGQQLHQFLQTAQAYHLRCVLVVHGKGSRSQAGTPRIKTQVNAWLRDSPNVLAFCSAQARQGGTGALYVLLKTGRGSTSLAT
jgi:DNA-nicking Smr family endonuclease